MSKDYPDLRLTSTQFFLKRKADLEARFNVFFDFVKAARLRDEAVKTRRARWKNSVKGINGTMFLINQGRSDFPAGMR